MYLVHMIQDGMMMHWTHWNVSKLMISKLFIQANQHLINNSNILSVFMIKIGWMKLTFVNFIGFYNSYTASRINWNTFSNSYIFYRFGYYKIEVLILSRRHNKNQDPINDKNSPDLTDDEKNRKTNYTPNLEKTRREANK